MLPGRRRASPRAPSSSSSSSSSSRSESSEYALSAARASVRAPCRDGPAPALGGFRGESGDAPGSVPVSVPVAVAVPVAGASFRRLPGTPFAGAARACLEGFPAERLFFVAGGGSGTRLGERGGRVADLVSRGAGHELRDGKRARVLPRAPHRALAEGTPGGVSGRRRRRRGSRGWGDRVLAGPASLLGLRRRHRRGRRGAPHNGRDGRERLARPTAFLARHDLRGRRPDGHRDFGFAFASRGPTAGSLGRLLARVVGGQQSRHRHRSRGTRSLPRREIESDPTIHASVRTGANTTSVGASSVSALSGGATLGQAGAVREDGASGPKLRRRRAPCSAYPRARRHQKTTRSENQRERQRTSAGSRASNQQKRELHLFAHVLRERRFPSASFTASSVFWDE